MFFPGLKKYGIDIVVDLHVTPGGVEESRDMAMLHDARYADAFVDVWRDIARRCKGKPRIWGYDLVNEPVQTRRKAFSYLAPVDLTDVIYQVHMYVPTEFTHQGVYGGAPIAYPNADRGWNREMLKKTLEPVRDFQRRHGARIYVGEFSAICWAEGADRYISDCISIFEESGWDWTTTHSANGPDGALSTREPATPTSALPPTIRASVLCSTGSRGIDGVESEAPSA